MHVYLEKPDDRRPLGQLIRWKGRIKRVQPPIQRQEKEIMRGVESWELQSGGDESGRSQVPERERQENSHMFDNVIVHTSSSNATATAKTTLYVCTPKQSTEQLAER